MVLPLENFESWLRATLETSGTVWAQIEIPKADHIASVHITNTFTGQTIRFNFKQPGPE